ncbi:MAG: integrin alpha [Candidatus Promineifilaceae bacterium]|nr:integrin alpha [Candidatus Promineifilaceae bacterium]
MRSKKGPILLISLVALVLILAVPALGAGNQPVPEQPDTVIFPEGVDPFVERQAKVRRAYQGENVFDAYGWVGANVGDLNGDGPNEYIITAPFYQAFDTQEGRAYVYSGRTGLPIAVHTGNPGERLGFSAAAAGDVNGDGVLDYVLGAPSLFDPDAHGRAIVYSGADHSVIHEWTGEPAAFFGSAVNAAGDVNGDGYDDVVVGAEFAGSTPGASFPDGAGRITVFSGADGSVLWSRDGLQDGDWLGSGAGHVADANGDGVPDVIAAARAADSFNGRAYVYSGVDGSIIHTLAPTAPLSNSGTFGRFFARGAGDVDADGTEDVFIGDYRALNGDGRAYVYSGADGSVIHVFDAEASGDSIGPGRGIPDVNRDGHADVIVAGWRSSAGATEGGKVWVRSGADGSILHTATGEIEGDQLGVDALYLGDISGDGRPEYLLTAVGLDFAGEDVGHAYVTTFKTAPPR